MTYRLHAYNGQGGISNEAGEILYYGSVRACREMLADWKTKPLTPAQERELIDAQKRRTNRAWARLFGQPA
jgi:hypothetical protein